MSLIRVALLVVVSLLLTAGLAQAAPTVLAPPVIGGTPVVGQQLAAAGLELDGATADDVSFAWERSDGHGWIDVVDAQDPTYTPTRADAGHRLRVRVAVETADGADAAWSEPTEPVAFGTTASAAVTRVGPAPGAPVRLSRWIVTAGATVRLSGTLDASLVTADARLVLEPTVATYGSVEAPVAIDAGGRVRAEVAPTVNAVAWLELAPAGEATQRVRLGLVGVRPRIGLVLGARADGRDVEGRPLVRDLRLLPGSVLAPGVAGLRLTWEGMLPGDRTGTAVCRSSERITSGADGRLRGGCRTRGSWATARWRLVLDPGTADPTAAPFLPAASAWVVPRVVGRPTEVPNLPRASATLRAWI